MARSIGHTLNACWSSMVISGHQWSSVVISDHTLNACSPPT
jgi:hypothetical protein